MGAAEQIQLASLRHLFYLIGYGSIVGHSQVGRLPAFCCDRAVAFRRTESPRRRSQKGSERTNQSVCLQRCPSSIPYDAYRAARPVPKLEDVRGSK